jgi:hypothetical protein
VFSGIYIISDLQHLAFEKMTACFTNLEKPDKLDTQLAVIATLCITFQKIPTTDLLLDWFGQYATYSIQQFRLQKQNFAHYSPSHGFCRPYPQSTRGHLVEEPLTEKSTLIKIDDSSVLLPLPQSWTFIMIHVGSLSHRDLCGRSSTFPLFTDGYAPHQPQAQEQHTEQPTEKPTLATQPPDPR